MKILIGVIIVLAAVAWLTRYLFRRITVFQSERGLLYKRGKFISVLDPGVYWYIPYYAAITKVDARLKYASLVGQEILSSDNVSLKLSLTVAYEYADLAIAINNIQNVDQAVHLEIQQVARDIIGQHKVDEILEKRGELSQRLFEKAPSHLAPLGITVKSISIRDITFPGELKKIFSEVVRAQKEGVAALERARGETAALRNLANAAKMMEGNPGLLQLRLIQAVGSTSGNTIVFGTSSNDQIIPVKKQGSQSEPASSVSKSTNDSQ